ncbi:MAG: hypothetical protein K8R40_12510 [Anaerolineaceae bacterium]|nr:hypothetical protein [Anaerolineaceae bacterium]
MNKTNTLYLYAAEISVGGMNEFLRSIGLTFDYLILEFYHQVIFETFDINLINNEEDVNRGRAFSNEYEIKWRRKGEKFVIALAAEIALNSKAAQKFDCEPVNYAKMVKPKNGLFLWGKYLDQVKINKKVRHRWFEKRIPQPQLYPINEPLAHVCLKTADYYDIECRLIVRRLIELYPWEYRNEEE